MGRRSDGEALRIIKERVAAGACVATDHASSEMEDEDIHTHDSFHAIANGTLVAVYTKDPRGTRYAIKGPGLDGLPIIAICRILHEEVRLVTTFRVG